MRTCTLIAACLAWAAPLHADADRSLPTGVQIGWIGEIHDNPAHHAYQAEVVAASAPAALVFEMLTPGQAARPTATDRQDADRLGAALRWDESGWPEWEMYAPIFLAAPEAQLYGTARGRDEMRQSVTEGAAAVFGAAAPLFGLDQALPDDQQAVREEGQMVAHCNAMPVEMMGGMVEAQRLRDADLAYTALTALLETGGPVIVIAGNGHVRGDWGAPSLLALADPDIRQHIVHLSEEGTGTSADPGAFGVDEVVALPEVTDRGDPCAVFARD